MRAFIAIETLAFRIATGLRAVHQGLWLGLLDRADLQAATDLQYDAWAQYSDRGYNLSGLLDWEAAVVGRFLCDCPSILVGAAGGGREIVGLSRRGIRADGFDCSSKLVESGRALLTSEHVPSRLETAFPGDVPDELGVYDGAMVGWGGYMHIAGSDARIEFLSKLRRHVRPDAPLVLSFFTRAPDAKRFRWAYHVARVIRRSRLNAERPEVGDALSSTFDHHFTRSEIEREMNAGGFDVVWYTEAPYGHAVGRARGSLGA